MGICIINRPHATGLYYGWTAKNMTQPIHTLLSYFALTNNWNNPPSWWKLGESFVNWCEQKWNSTCIQGDYLNGRLCHDRPSTISPYQYLHMASPIYTTNSLGPAIPLERNHPQHTSPDTVLQPVPLYKCLYQLSFLGRISFHDIYAFPSRIESGQTSPPFSHALITFDALTIHPLHS